ncbi:MAG: biosynthetic-type acetolactate synthase large subunit [Candidatus Dormibacteria bacterium]
MVPGIATRTTAAVAAADSPARRLTGAEIILECLRRESVDVIFGYPGGANLPIYQHLPRYPGIHHVLVRHEQGAAHMADGYARASGRVGVCLATSGPGALNLTTGLATAHMDSVPMVAITGQVPTAMVGRDAFQESDVIGVTMPVTKHSYLVRDVADLEPVIHEAFHIARSGRPGPVLVDIPRDLQQATWSLGAGRPEVSLRGFRPTVLANALQVRRAADAISRARRPVLLAGHGVILAHAEEELVRFAEGHGIPVGTTLLGVGAFPTRSPLSLHMTGFMGTGWCLRALCEADLLIMVGMRVDDRVTARLSDFAPKAETVIHCDIDPAEIGKNVATDIPVVADARQFLSALDQAMPARDADPEWMAQIEGWRREHPLRQRGGAMLQPQEVMRELYDLSGGDAIVVADVGQNQIWAALWWDSDRPGLFLNSGGSGTMGYALPAAIGARLARPDRRVVCVTGEGGFVMNMQELSTLVQEGADVKIVLLNNASLGMVRQFQDDYYGGVRSQVALEAMPDFMKLADAFGIPGRRAETRDQAREILREAWATPGPALLEFVIDPDANVYPIIPLGGGIHEFVEEPAS